MQHEEICRDNDWFGITFPDSLHPSGAFAKWFVAPGVAEPDTEAVVVEAVVVEAVVVREVDARCECTGAIPTTILSLIDKEC